MKFIIFILSTLCIIYSCHDRVEQADTNISLEKFNKTKWSVQHDLGYPHRDKMLKDLVYHVKLKGLKKEEVLDLPGSPDRIDSSYLFYKIVQKRLGFFPLPTKTLAIKLAEDNTVARRKIHE